MSVLRTGAKSDLTASRVHVKMNPPSSRLPANRSVKAAGFYPLAPWRRVAVNHRGGILQRTVYAPLQNALLDTLPFAIWRSNFFRREARYGVE